MTDAPKPLGMSDFFALEAGEYLERLDRLLAKGDNPSADEILRLARALRGSAPMANRHPIARTAPGLEAPARAGRGGRRACDPPTPPRAPCRRSPTSSRESSAVSASCPARDSSPRPT